MVTGTMQSVPPSMMNGNMAASNELPKRPGDNRRSNKPIMEKRRRARINNCLNELKTLILDATKKDPARHSKLEKADILEKTVKYLQDLQRQQTAMLQASDPQIYNKFKAGFAECIKEVDRFPGIDPAIKRRLLQHLGTYISGVRAEDNNKTKIQQVQIHMLPSSPPGSPEQDQQLLHTQQQILQLTPTNGCYLSLPNGVVYLAPPHIQQIPPKVAMPSLTNIVNIPSRTSSTASATSNHSSTEKLNHDLLQSPMCYAPPSPANSYEAMEYPTPTPPENHYHKSMNSYQLKNMNLHASAERHRPYSPGPLSLVMKKEGQNDEEEERPWRPW